MKHVFARKIAACTLAIAVAGGSTIGFAAERSPSDPASSSLLASAQQQVRLIAATPVPAAVRAAQQEGTGGSGYDTPGSFFKTKRGVAILVLAAVGIGYMTYSAYDDRIHSEARERRGN